MVEFTIDRCDLWLPATINNLAATTPERFRPLTTTSDFTSPRHPQRPSPTIRLCKSRLALDCTCRPGNSPDGQINEPPSRQISSTRATLAPCPKSTIPPPQYDVHPVNNFSGANLPAVLQVPSRFRQALSTSRVIIHGLPNGIYTRPGRLQIISRASSGSSLLNLSSRSISQDEAPLSSHGPALSGTRPRQSTFNLF